MCDITFNVLGVVTTEMLDHLFTIQPNAAELCLVVKEYLKLREVKLKNYAVVLMVVFFLQQYDLLPSFQDVLSGLERLTIDGKLYFNELIYLKKNVEIVIGRIRSPSRRRT